MSPSPLRSIIRIFGLIDQLKNFMICSTKENQKSNPENHLAKEYCIFIGKQRKDNRQQMMQ